MAKRDMGAFEDAIISVLIILFLVAIIGLLIFGAVQLHRISTAPSEGRIPTTEERRDDDGRFTVRDRTEQWWGPGRE